MDLLNDQVVNQNRTYFKVNEFKELNERNIIKFFLAFAYSESKDVGYLVELDGSSFDINGHKIDNLVFRGY